MLQFGNILRKCNFLKFSFISRKYLSFGDQVEEYKHNGVACLRGCFSQRWVIAVQQGIGKVLNNPSKYSEKITSDNGKGVYFNDYLQWRNINEFQKFIKDSPAPKIAAMFLQEEEVAFYHEHTFVKESFNESVTPWHHDQSYYPIDGWQNCSLWMPVTPVEAGSIQFIKGSHKWGKWFAPRYFETTENYVVEKEGIERHYETVPEINEQEHELLSWNMEPGDCLVFHMRVIHGSYAKTATSTSRQTLVTRWLGKDATLAKRPWRTSPPVQPNDITFGDLVKNSQDFPVYSVLNGKYINGFQ